MDGAGNLAAQLIAALTHALPDLIEAASIGLATLTTLWATRDWTAMTEAIQRSEFNFVTRWPPGLTYNLGGVMDFYNSWQPAFLGGGALACVVGAFGAVGRTYLGWSWHLGEMASRLVIGLVLALNAPRFYQIVCDLANRLTDAIITTPLPNAPASGEVDPVSAAIILGVWVVLGFRLLVRSGYGLSYFDLLLAVGPIALAGLFIPGGEPYARFWLKAFFGLIIGKVLVAVCLRLAGVLTSALGASIAALALGIGILLLAHDMTTLFTQIRGGGLGRTVRGARSVVGI